MTSIHIYDPSDGAALPELPPLPIGVLAVGTADLLQQAADLPQPALHLHLDHAARQTSSSPRSRRACAPSPAGRCGSAAS